MPPSRMTSPDLNAAEAARILQRRAWFAIGAVVAIQALNLGLVQPSLLGLATDAPAINIAGRQRMLSQRLAKSALALAAAREESYRAELRETLELWVRSHHALQAGDPALSLSGRLSPEARAGFAALMPSFELLRDSATRIEAATDSGLSPSADLAALLGAESEFLGRMDALVGLLERESREHVAQLRLILLILTLAAIASALAIGSFALRPAVLLIRRQVDELEHRVRVRTAELEAESLRRIEVERKNQELQERIGRAAKAGALGEQAAELAHELNQPLGAIANYIEGSLLKLEPGQARDVALRGALTHALDATHRAATIVRRVYRSILRPVRLVHLDPNALVAEVVQSCTATAERRGIDLEMDLALDLPSIRADGVQIQQVLANLVQNAFDAVDAANRPSRSVVVATGLDDWGVVFRVIDNGEGIPPAALASIFDPYFSTRANGLGMGLAISRRIVTEHGGRIAAECELGRQTTIQFTLPAAGDGERTDGLHR